MAASTWLRADHRGAPLLLAAALLPSLSSVVHAKAPAQRQKLTAALRQLDAQERTMADSAAHTPIAPGERHRFDHPRLPADLAPCAPAFRPASRLHAPSRVIPPNRPGTAAPSGPHPRLRRRRADHEWRPGFRIPNQWRHCAFYNGDGARRRRLRRPARMGRMGQPNGLRECDPKAASTGAGSSASSGFRRCASC